MDRSTTDEKLAALRRLTALASNLGCMEPEWDWDAMYALIADYEQRIPALVEATIKLSNEAKGSAALARDCIGNTNANLLEQRVDEARDALSHFESPK